MDNNIIPGNGGESPDPAAKAIPPNLAGAMKEMEEFAAKTPANMPAIAEAEIDQFRKVTYLLIGAILNHHKRGAVTLTMRELEKFENGPKEVVLINLPNGDLRYELKKKAKVK